MSSLQELLPYLKQSNVELKMEPGTYTVTAKDAKAGKFGVHGWQDKTITVFLFEGSNSTYDFTNVTINIETKVYSSLGKFDVRTLQIQGNHNVLKNLTLNDVGSIDDAPTTRATSVVMDGKHNRIEGFNMAVKGSYPYGYGELFGKGGKNIIRHRKHSAFLIRGYANHALNCTIDHQSFGHAIYMQAADKPVIEGCTVEGVMRNSNEVLAEKGTGSPADKANFMTYFGHRVPRNYMFCTGEEGIRAYNGGTTYIDGKIIKRGTSNPTVLNCTVKKMRGGVTLAHATGKKYVQGTKALGCTQGFSIGSGEIVDCYADLQYGPALSFAYERDNGVNAEITLLPHEGDSVVGPGYAAFIMGKNHKIIFRSQLGDATPKLHIQVSGDKRNIGSVKKKDTLKAQNIEILNATNLPIVLDRFSEYITGESIGKVTDRGKNNKVKQSRGRS